jgi:hypothetical protein
LPLQGFEPETYKNKITLFTTALLLACVNFVGNIVSNGLKLAQQY